jgi:hypothetical protein
VVLRQNQYVSETKLLPTRTVLLPTRTVMAGQPTMTAETRAARFASNNSHGNLKLMNMAKPRKHPAL